MRPIHPYPNKQMDHHQAVRMAKLAPEQFTTEFLLSVVDNIEAEMDKIAEDPMSKYAPIGLAILKMERSISKIKDELSRRELEYRKIRKAQ